MKEYQKKWLSLGYLTDQELVEAVNNYRKKISEPTGVLVPLAYVVRVLLRRGLEGA